MNRSSSFVSAPSVVAESLFAKLSYRGFRMQATDVVPPEQIHSMIHSKPIRVHDARQLDEAPSIETMGFELLDAPIDLDFGNEELVTSSFYDYCAELVEATTGCISAETVQHEFRTDLVAPRGEPGAYAPAAHADMSPLIEDAFSIVSDRHFGIYNVWRSIDFTNPIETYPLALCDPATVIKEDMVCADGWRRTYPRTQLVFYYLIHNNRQVWFYYPRMEADEVIIFRQYDSRIGDPSNRVTFHTAFKDATTPINAPLRKTIEARVLAFFRDRDTSRATRTARYQAEVPKFWLTGEESPWTFEPMVDWRMQIN